jgi:flagellar hook-length control protein FliK
MGIQGKVGTGMDAFSSLLASLTVSANLCVEKCASNDALLPQQESSHASDGPTSSIDPSLLQQEYLPDPGVDEQTLVDVQTRAILDLMGQTHTPTLSTTRVENSNHAVKVSYDSAPHPMTTTEEITSLGISTDKLTDTESSRNTPKINLWSSVSKDTVVHSHTSEAQHNEVMENGTEPDLLIVSKKSSTRVSLKPKTTLSLKGQIQRITLQESRFESKPKEVKDAHFEGSEPLSEPTYHLVDNGPESVSVSTDNTAETTDICHINMERAREIGERLAEQARKDLPKTVEFCLKQPAIGKVSVILSSKGEDITVRFIAEDYQASQLLESSISTLGQALNDAGLTLLGFSVSTQTGSARKGSHETTKRKRSSSPARIDTTHNEQEFQSSRWTSGVLDYIA